MDHKYSMKEWKWMSRDTRRERENAVSFAFFFFHEWIDAHFHCARPRLLLYISKSWITKSYARDERRPVARFNKKMKGEKKCFSHRLIIRLLHSIANLTSLLFICMPPTNRMQKANLWRNSFWPIFSASVRGRLISIPTAKHTTGWSQSTLW